MKSNVKRQQIPLEQLINQMPGYFLWKDLNSVFTGANDATTKLFGYKKTEQLVGTTDFDIRCDAAKFAHISLKQDEKLKKLLRPLTILDVRPYINGEVKALLINKSLIKNTVGNMVGIACHCLEVNDALLNQIGIHLYNKTLYNTKKSGSNYYVNHEYEYEYEHEQIKLSNRQSVCLFYMLYGKSAAETAQIMKISRRTVESYIEEIKNKMNCRKKSEIIEAAISLGLNEIIPPGVLKNIIYI